jgi:hypothetical protein
VEPYSFYNLADIEVKPNKLKEYHEYWSVQGPDHWKGCATVLGTWNVISGGESTTHVKRLFRIDDLDEWMRRSGEEARYLPDRWAEMALNVKCTLLFPESYSNLK